MSNGDQSVFTFDLQEVLWFKKGQEVNEVMGISLEPEISIQEFDDFVSVRGVIELKGEYFQIESSEDQDEEEQVLSLRDHPSQRFVDRVESYEDGVNELFHTFPVEVSIPKYRIQSLDDVMVGIDSFDYEIPENSQLKLNATVAIHGVREDNPEPVDSNESVEEYVGETEEDMDEQPPSERQDAPFEETFEFDVKEKAAIEEVNEVEEVKAEEEHVEVDEPVEKKEKDRWKNKKTQTLAEFFAKDKEKAKEDGVVDDVSKFEFESSESSSISFSANAKADLSEESLESSREANGQQQDPTYLLNIFNDKEEEERYSRLKMCIVQESDTLDSIAERYEISPINISQTNKLTDDELSEGQILYIPTKKIK